MLVLVELELGQKNPKHIFSSFTHIIQCRGVSFKIHLKRSFQTGKKPIFQEPSGYKYQEKVNLSITSMILDTEVGMFENYSYNKSFICLLVCQFINLSVEDN